MRQRSGISAAVLFLYSSYVTASSVKIEANSREDTLRTGPWVPNEFPDPDLDQRACRTLHNRLCDPDFILQESQLRVVEDYLNRERIFTPYCRERDENETSQQVQLAVALIRKVRHVECSDQVTHTFSFLQTNSLFVLFPDGTGSIKQPRNQDRNGNLCSFGSR
jgi:hypothetical protein